MRKLLSIFLTLIFLTSNLGFALAKHHCGGLLVESKIILGYEKLDCGMPNMDEEHSLAPFPNQEIQFKKGKCCENEYQYLDTDDNFNQTFVEYQINFLLTEIHSIRWKSAPWNLLKIINPADSSPPLVLSDILILHRVFRI